LAEAGSNSCEDALKFFENVSALTHLLHPGTIKRGTIKRGTIKRTFEILCLKRFPSTTHPSASAALILHTGTIKRGTIKRTFEKVCVKRFPSTTHPSA
jgi:hypothetical protein